MSQSSLSSLLLRNFGAQADKEKKSQRLIPHTYSTDSLVSAAVMSIPKSAK